MNHKVLMRARFLLLILVGPIFISVFTDGVFSTDTDDAFTIHIGQNQVFTTYNIYNTTLQSPVNHTTQGRPIIMDAVSEGASASVHVRAEVLQEGSADAIIGVQFNVKESPTDQDTMEADVAFTVEYRLNVDFNVPEVSPPDAGGSADALMQGIIVTKSVHMDRIHFIHYGNRGSNSDEQTFTSTILLQAGQAYQVVVILYAYGDVYQSGYADSAVDVTVKEISITFREPFPINPMILAIGGTSVSLVAGQQLLRRRPTSSSKIKKKLERQQSKEAEKEKNDKTAEEKKSRKSQRQPRLVYSVEVPSRIIGDTATRGIIHIENKGSASAKHIVISLEAALEITFDQRVIDLPELRPRERQHVQFDFRFNPEAKKGVYPLHVLVKSSNTPYQHKRQFIRLFKIGVIVEHHQFQPSFAMQAALKDKALSWNTLSDAEDYLELLRYDILILNPELNLSPRATANLVNFIENGQSLLIIDHVRTADRTMLAHTLGYQGIRSEAYKGETFLQICDTRHELTRHYAMGQQIVTGPSSGHVLIANKATGQTLATRAIRLITDPGTESTLTVPGITINYQGDGRIIHLNFPLVGDPQTTRIFEDSLEWLLHET